MNNKNILHSVFVHMYFDIGVSDRLDYVDEFINNEDNAVEIMNYLKALGLRFMVGDVLTKTVRPQFKFECNKDYQLNILKFHFGKVYLKKGAMVYATNLFVKNPNEVLDVLIQTVPKNDQQIINMDNKYYMWNGSDGFLFARPYLDWMGMKVCKGTPYSDTDLYRLYVVGDFMAQKLVEADLTVETFLGAAVLKNYHKGTPLRRRRVQPIKQKHFNTKNVDSVFDVFQNQFDNGVDTIHFVQREYIYDATNFSFELLDELQRDWISDLSVYKMVEKFEKTQKLDYETVVIDRFGENNYTQLVVPGNYELPINHSSKVEHLFIPEDGFLQIRHTLNAALVSELGIVILARHMFFGTRRVIDFVPDDDTYLFVKNKSSLTTAEMEEMYHIFGPYFAHSTTFPVNDIPIFVLYRISDDLIVRHNLIRLSRKLIDIKYNWVHNTILNLFVKKPNGHIQRT